MNSSSSLAQLVQEITNFLSQQPIFIFEDHWIVENQADVVRIFRDYDDYTIRIELSVDRKRRLFIWNSDTEKGSCSLEEVEDFILEDNPKDTSTSLSEDPSDRIVLIMKNGQKKAVSPYYFKFSSGQHSYRLLKMLKKYIREEG